MTDSIQIHRLRRACEIYEGLGAEMSIVRTDDLRHAIERLDKLTALFEDWQPTRVGDIQLKEEALSL